MYILYEYMYLYVSWVHIEPFRRCRRRRRARFIGVMSDTAQGAFLFFILYFNVYT